MTASTPPHRVMLWVDDDGRERFLYEEYVLRENGWEVCWATCVADAKEQLRGESFDAVVLDLCLPLSTAAGREGDIWGGCHLLYWLRGIEAEGGAMPKALEDAGHEQGPPRPENRAAKVIVASGFYDDEIYGAIARAGDVPQISKPLDTERLIAALG